MRAIALLGIASLLLAGRHTGGGVDAMVDKERVRDGDRGSSTSTSSPRELYEAAGSAVLVPTKLPDLTALVATGSHLVVLQIYDGDGADERSMQLAQPYADVASALDSLVIFVAVDVRRRRRLAEQIAEKCVLVSPRLSLSREREREMRIERR